MYIAFKWLFGLTFFMWLAMCCLDAFTKNHFLYSMEGLRSKEFVNMENKTDPLTINMNVHNEKLPHKVTKKYSMVYLHCFMFISGALVVSVYNRIDAIKFMFTVITRKVRYILTKNNTNLLKEYFKITAATVYGYASILFNGVSIKLKQTAYKFKSTICKKINMKIFCRPRVNIMLLKKLKEVGEERRNLAQLLIAALQENKHVRMQYQLENMAKKRLVQHIEKTEKLIKENRSKYVSFQQLYLVTHQENTFLKCRLKKLTSEKEEAERDLMELLKEVFKSKNKALKTFCNRFMVRTKSTLLNLDAETEVQNFLRKARGPVASYSNRQLSERSDVDVKKANSWLRCSSFTNITEFIKDNNIVPLTTEAPKLRGLPGEHVWTVKDKDGLIEKLYEYDYEDDFDAGDTIRRIREYSVYHDKDCLLDLSNSTTIVTEQYGEPGTRMPSYTALGDPVTNKRFLTGSAAFKKFMQDNENVVKSILPTRRILAK